MAYSQSGPQLATVSPGLLSLRLIFWSASINDHPLELAPIHHQTLEKKTAQAKENVLTAYPNATAATSQTIGEEYLLARTTQLRGDNVIGLSRQTTAPGRFF